MEYVQTRTVLHIDRFSFVCFGGLEGTSKSYLTQNKISIFQGLLLICLLEKKQSKECTQNSVTF